MAGFATYNTEHLERTSVWDPQLKRVLDDVLLGNKYVRMIPYWGGGTLNIPSIGRANTRDYTEGQQIVYDAMDTGNFQFLPTEYKSAATYITNKMKQDTFYMNELVSSFVPSQARALAVAMEVKMLETGPASQTLTSTNSINGCPHRWVGSGTNETMNIVDFAKINYSLEMANVPQRGRVGIVHPSVAFALATQTNLVNLSNNPSWTGIVSKNYLTGLSFVASVYGIDLYTSQNLKVNAASETISGVTAAAGVNNLFFSAESDVLPFVGTIMQSPKVDSEYNKDWQREEYVTTCRYGFKTFRPENLVIVVTDTDQVF